MDAEDWNVEYDSSRQAVQDIVTIIQERNTKHPVGGPEASRKTAAARRKLGALGTQLEKLSAWLDGPDGQRVSERERHRRRDLVHALKTRREQILVSIKRPQANEMRTELLSGPQTQTAPRETERTAELDNLGLLRLQHQVMKEQDTSLEVMEQTVSSTKHIALAIGEEVDLHTRLLEDLDEDIDHTHTRLRAINQRVKHMLRHSSSWRGGLVIFLLAIVLVVVILLAFKIALV
jgi:syntaxin of plants SYP5